MPASQASIQALRSPGHQRPESQRLGGHEKGWEESQDPPQPENDSARPLPPPPPGGWASRGRAPHLTPAPSGWRRRVAAPVPRRAGGPSVTAASAPARSPSVDGAQECRERRARHHTHPAPIRLGDAVETHPPLSVLTVPTEGERSGHRGGKEVAGPSLQFGRGSGTQGGAAPNPFSGIPTP